MPCTRITQKIRRGKIWWSGSLADIIHDLGSLKYIISFETATACQTRKKGWVWNLFDYEKDEVE